jgi:hypothetical protein
MTLMDAFRRQAEVAAALRLEDWLKGARIPKPPSDSGVDLDQMRDDWEQVLLSFEDALLIAVFTNDWRDFDELVNSLRTDKVSHSQDDETTAEQNLNSLCDIAFGKL